VRGDKREPSAWGYNWATLFLYRDLALQVGGVTDETLKYGYGSCATRTNEWLHCKLQSRPLVREGTPNDEDWKVIIKHNLTPWPEPTIELYRPSDRRLSEKVTTFEKIKICSWAPKGARHEDELVDWTLGFVTLNRVYWLPGRQWTPEKNSGLGVTPGKGALVILCVEVGSSVLKMAAVSYGRILDFLDRSRYFSIK
jgi:hypothetical protein